MKKKLIFIFLALFTLFTASSCSNRMTLLFLNWGEYIDESLIEAFEQKYNCNVQMDLGESNEIFYSKVFSGTTVYDVVCPSDYMVMKMYKNNLIKELDFDKLPTYMKHVEDGEIREGIDVIKQDMIDGTSEDITKYYVPYLWGTWGIMYSTTKDGLEDAVTKGENEWQSLYDRSILPAGTKVAMYDSHQHAYYSACRYLGLDPEKELPQSKLDQIKNLVKKMNYDAWGTDDIKKDIVATNLDVGFMWTGDFLYFYAEQAAVAVCNAYKAGAITVDEFIPMLDAITDSSVRKYKGYEIGFDIFIPQDTIAFCDNLVIPAKSSSAKEDLTYKFIDFMCSYDVMIDEEIEEDNDDNHIYPANANTQFVCYDTPYTTIYHEILDLKDSDADTLDYFNEDDAKPIKQTDDFDELDIYWGFYNYALSIAFYKYYPENGKKGSILGCFDRKYVNQINKTFNNARV